MKHAAHVLSTCLACLALPATDAQPSPDSPQRRISVRSQTGLPPFATMLLPASVEDIMRIHPDTLGRQ